MFLMRSVARRYLSPRAVPIAVGLFALDDWLLYYSVEIKQYCSERRLTLVAFLLAAGPAAGHEPAAARRSCRLRRGRRLVLASAGAGARGPWGLTWSAKAAVRRDWKKVSGFVGNEPALGLSFAVCYMVSHRILSKEQIHLELVGLCLLADSAALACRPLTRLLASDQHVQQSRLGGHAAGRARFGVSRDGVFLDRLRCRWA